MWRRLTQVLVKHHLNSEMRKRQVRNCHILIVTNYGMHALTKHVKHQIAINYTPTKGIIIYTCHMNNDIYLSDYADWVAFRALVGCWIYRDDVRNLLKNKLKTRNQERDTWWSCNLHFYRNAWYRFQFLYQFSLQEIIKCKWFVNEWIIRVLVIIYINKIYSDRLWV